MHAGPSSSARAGAVGHRAGGLGPREDVGLQVVHVRVPQVQPPSLVGGYQELAPLLRAAQEVTWLPMPCNMWGSRYVRRPAHQLYDSVAAPLQLHLHGACGELQTGQHGGLFVQQLMSEGALCRAPHHLWREPRVLL